MDLYRQRMPGWKVLGFRENTTYRNIRIYEAKPRPRGQWEWKEAKTPQLIRVFESSV